MSTCLYRPPWPDEMERLHALLADDRPSSSWQRPRVWETPAPHRFAGAATWSPPENENREGSVEIRFQLRAGFCDPLVAGELLRSLFTEIHEAGYRRAYLMLTARDAWEKILVNFGLHWTGMNECWVADAMDGYHRVQASAARWATRRPERWMVRNIEESDLEFVFASSGAADFFDAPNLQRVWKNRSHALSCIIQAPTGPAGVLLATRFGMTAILEFLGTSPEFRKDSALVSYLGLTHLARRDHPETFDRYLTLVNPAKGDASRTLMRRFGGHPEQTYHHFAGEIQLPVVA